MTRFMILGSARTGSNFLLSLLSAHPSIKTYGELFNLDSLPQPVLQEALEDPVLYLRRRVYASIPITSPPLASRCSTTT